jgi:hypothetical protein
VRSGFVFSSSRLVADAQATWQSYRDTGTWPDRRIETLCSLVKAIKPTPTIYTANTALAASLHSACPTPQAKVVVEHGAVPYIPTRMGPQWAMDGMR